MAYGKRKFFNNFRKRLRCSRQKAGEFGEFCGSFCPQHFQLAHYEKIIAITGDQRLELSIPSQRGQCSSPGSSPDYPPSGHADTPYSSPRASASNLAGLLAFLVHLVDLPPKNWPRRKTPKTFWMDGGNTKSLCSAVREPPRKRK